jgi:hypothetical protein
MYEGLVTRKVHDLAVPLPVLASNGAASVEPPPIKHKRIRLDSIDRIRFELAKIYSQARDGERDTQDFSRLANGLSILGAADRGRRSGAAPSIRWPSSDNMFPSLEASDTSRSPSRASRYIRASSRRTRCMLSSRGRWRGYSATPC